MSTTPSTFISGLYTNVLRRTVAAGTATNAELLSWDALVTANLLTQAQVTSAIVNSVEATTIVAPVIRIYQTFFNRVPDSAGLDFWVGRFRSGTSLASISSSFSTASEFTAAYGTPSASTIDSFLSALYTNVLGRTADATGFAFWKAQFAAQGSNAAAAAAIANSFSSSAEFTTASATNITNLLTAAASTGSLGTGPLGGTAGSSTGTTFNLTTGIDAFTGTSGNDLFQGPSTSLGSLDTINGGAGTDNVLLSSAADFTVTGAQLTAIETLTVNSTTATVVTISGVSGLTTLANSASSAALTFGVTATPIPNLTALNVSNVGNTATTVVFNDTSLSGTADAITVTLNAATAAGTININSSTGNTIGFETINLVSSGTVSNSVTLETNDTAGLTALNVSGSTAATVALSATLAGTLRTLSASAATGAVTVTGIGATVLAATGGSGADSFDFNGNFIGLENATAANRDTFDGGAGRDTLSSTSANLVTASGAVQTGVTNVEILRVTNAQAGDIDASRFASVDTVILAAATAAATTNLTVATGTTITLGSSSADDSVSSFTVAGTATTDTVTLNMAGFSFGGTGTETFTGIETLNIELARQICTARISGVSA